MLDYKPEGNRYVLSKSSCAYAKETYYPGQANTSTEVFFRALLCEIFTNFMHLSGDKSPSMDPVIPIRVTIIDDHHLFLEGLASLLQGVDGIEVVQTADSSAGFLEQYFLSHTDVILLDINMPRLNGIETLKQLLEKDKSAKVIMLSSYDESHLIRQSIALGASGYLLKNAHSTEIVQAIKAVYAGERYFQGGLKETGRNDNAQVSGEGEAVVNFLSLTNREKEILDYVIQGATSRYISSRLHISFHTVKTHRKNILRKLGLNTHAELIKFVMQNGLK